ncbi:hypothetical protein THOA03_60060 [Vibrio owensii]|nr:hypothetical protein THOA03_60060 [Vibrio owensii]
MEHKHKNWLLSLKLYKWCAELKIEGLNQLKGTVSIAQT